MTITQLTDMAERIHDVEGWNLGASSTRETRNAFWERVMGCAHWGHPTYNATPDKQWHCKDPDGPQGGRPASDDVAVSMPSRNAWDCIPGAGADGYRFEADDAPFYLEAAQFVFVPAKPAGSGTTPPPVIPPAAATYPYPDEPTFWTAHTNEVKRRYPGGVLNDEAFRWFSRAGHNSALMPPAEASKRAIKELDDITGGPLP